MVNLQEVGYTIQCSPKLFDGLLASYETRGKHFHSQGKGEYLILTI